MALRFFSAPFSIDRFGSNAVRSTVLLMRDGRLLADTTPDGLLRDTGAPDVESAFLALVEQTP
jgi:hypothetical protein